MNDYQSVRNVRRESRTLVGRFRGGKLAPIMAVPVRGNEGGMLSQSITLELDPIAGRMITPITGELVSVFVPVQAIDALKSPEADYAGLTEVLREKLLSGNPLFGLENESELTKRLGVNPRSVAGQKKVNEMVRIGHNAAVNFLRQRKYVKATLLSSTNMAVTPALISQTILERMNGVLDPEDRVNGMVQFQTGTITAPLSGVLPVVNPVSPTVDLAGGVANLTGLNVGTVSLTDFYNAEKQDAIVRTMRQIVDENPQYGEEILLRWAHGLNVDNGRIPFVIAERTMQFGRNIMPATDSAGVIADVMRSDMMLQIGFNVPIPATELGGIIITFASIKPDETISSQPHPFLSDVWGADNFVADEMALDPVPVTIRDLDSDCLSAQESTVALYTGLNAIKQTYVSYGLNRQLNPTTVANKTAVWQLEVPMSVTPDTILYPETLEHYPFADQAAEVCTYVVTSQATLKTPMIVGPTPVEELAIIETEDLFEDQ